ncbi:hypothetical protein HPB50_000112 [Hyalomma asiaticum]|uniref:Uncharacterized protein n=1 Tax=Hyalomma asiaticum TaxID=266040 RepID=A0ACB7SS40_HYAAI|nr:hypothetical protein HPB50_000112 [Hyalomma asiaticum]
MKTAVVIFLVAVAAATPCLSYTTGEREKKGHEDSDVRVEVGRALKTMGEWLQGEGTPDTEEERATLQEALQQIMALQAKDADLENIDPYIWDTLGAVATGIAKKAVIAFVTQQVMGLIGGAMG